MGLATGNTLTLLFTDIVASTDVATRDGDDAAQALRHAHDRILREQFEAFGGKVVKHTGDGFFVVFPSARQGVECAVALQRALATQQAEGRYTNLFVRVGVHTGEPAEEDGDYFGVDVALASRIAGVAGGGEILVSDTTHLLARSHTSVRFVASGTRQLKGIPEPVSVVRVQWAEDDLTAGRRMSRFVGREREHRRVRQRLDAALRGQGSIVLIAGEPGVGKSRLANEIAVEARDRGASVITGRAFEAEGQAPYQMFADALRDLMRQSTPELWPRWLADDASYIAKVVPEIRAVAPDLTEPTPMNPEAERYRLFEALSHTLLRASETDPLILVLDDLHWADTASIHLARHLMRQLPSARMLVLATYRDAEASATHPVVVLVDEMVRGNHGERVVLDALSPADATSLVADVLGSAPSPEFARALYETAAGNPFFTEEMVRHVREQGADSTAWVLPEGVRHVLLRRFERLSQRTQDIVMCGIVTGHELSVSLVAAVAGTTQDDVISAFEEACDARVLREDARGFAFAHPIVPEALKQSLGATKKRRLHRRTAEALEDLYGVSATGHAQEVAHHLLEGAATAVDAVAAAGVALRAGEQAMAVYAYDEAAAYYRRAAEALRRTGADDGMRCELLLALGTATMRAGDAPGADSTFQEAAALARSLKRGDLLAQAAMGVGDARRTGGVVDVPLTELLREALALMPEGDSAVRTRVMARLVWSLYHVEPLPVLAAMSEDVIAMARRLDDPATLLFALRSLLQFHHDPFDLEARLADANELERIARDLDDRHALLFVMQGQISLLTELGEIERADAVIAEFGRTAAEMRQPYYLWLHAVYVAMRALFDGRFDEAEKLAQAAFALGRDAQSETNLAFQFLAAQLFVIRWEQGRLNELAPVLADFVRQYPALRWRAGLAMLHSELGDDAAARREYEQFFSEGFVDVPDDFNQLIALTVLTELCTRFEDAARADVLYERVRPFEGRNVTIGAPAACVGAACRFLGMLAGTMQRWDEAEALFDRALSFNEAMGAAPMIARTQFHYARMLIRSGRPGSEPKVRELIGAAAEAAQRLGMARLGEETEALRKEARC